MRISKDFVDKPFVSGKGQKIKEWLQANSKQTAESHYVVNEEQWENFLVEIGLKKSRGLGDTIAKATKAVGIKPCGGCNKRRKKLNNIFQYK